MNSKFLYAATIAISLISTLALADEAPLTRVQVNAETRQAITDGTLRRTDYDEGSYRPLPVTSAVTRSQIATELAQSKAARRALAGPLANSRYDPDGLQVLQTSTLARSEVKNEVLAAAAAGTLQRTDYDDGSLARQARQHVAASRLAQRIEKGSGSGD